LAQGRGSGTIRLSSECLRMTIKVYKEKKTSKNYIIFLHYKSGGYGRGKDTKGWDKGRTKALDKFA